MEKSESERKCKEHVEASTIFLYKFKLVTYYKVLPKKSSIC